MLKTGVGPLPEARPPAGGRPARGWLAWWECTHCNNTNVTEAVDDTQVADWSRRLGPWYRSGV